MPTREEDSNNQRTDTNAILFMTAGYETTATTLQFIAYTLAMNQSVQNKLIDEIDHALEKHVTLTICTNLMKQMFRQSEIIHSF